MSKRDLYRELRLEHFTIKEARFLCKLPKSTPALREMREDRVDRWNKFEKLAATKIAIGKWRRSQVEDKWFKNLSRLYSVMEWRVKKGPRGRQERVGGKGSVNPWAMYRWYMKKAGGEGSKSYISPWEVAQIAGGTTKLEKGLVFVQRLERSAKKGELNRTQIAQWLAEKDVAIKEARGKRAEQLIIERNRLERLLR